MKIAMIGQKGLPAHAGGIERHVEELSAELVKRGHEVLAFGRSWYTAGITSCRGVDCIHTPGIKTKHLDAITHTFTAILKARVEGVDVYHFHGVGPSLLAWMPRVLSPNAKVMVTFHCIDRHHKKWGLFARLMLWLGERAAITFAHATITVSKALHDYCRMSYGADTIYIPNGTQLPTETPSATPLQTFGLTPNNYLLFCARLVRHKGAHVFMQAWKQLRAERPDLTEGKKIAIVGGSAFTDDYVKELTDAAASDESIVLTDTQTGEVLASLFGHAYALVHPSESEGLPIAVLEGMSYGKCVLSSDIPENLELTAEHGLTFRTNNVDDLARQMAMLLEHPELVRAVGADARAHVAKTYDWNDIADLTSSLYDVVVAEPTFKAQAV